MCTAPRTRSPTTAVDGLVGDCERCRDTRAPVGVGDEQGVAGESPSLGVEDRQGRRVSPVRSRGDQDRHLLAREAAFAGFAATPARLAVQLPLPLPALELEGLAGLDDPAKELRRLTARLQEAVTPVKRLHSAQSRSARRRQSSPLRPPRRRTASAPCSAGRTALLTAGLAASAADRAPCPARRRRRWPGQRRSSSTPSSTRRNILALRPSRQRRRRPPGAAPAQIVHTREPVPKSLRSILSPSLKRIGNIIAPCLRIAN